MTLALACWFKCLLPTLTKIMASLTCPSFQPPPASPLGTTERFSNVVANSTYINWCSDSRRWFPKKFLGPCHPLPAEPYHDWAGSGFRPPTWGVSMEVLSQFSDSQTPDCSFSFLFWSGFLRASSGRVTGGTVTCKNLTYKHI